MATRLRIPSAEVLLLLLLLLALPAVVQAQFNYTTNNGAITITGYTGPGGVVTIPSTINGLAVTSIGSSAFSGCPTVASVTIPDSVASIGSDAFYYCTSLTNVTIGSSVTNIGSGPFDICSSLTTIAVDPQNASFSSTDGVLFNKSQTTLLQCPGGKGGSYTIPGSVTSIGGGAFENCTSLTNVAVPSSVANLGNGPFANCSSLTTITVDPQNAFFSSADGVLFNKSQTTLIQCPGGRGGSYTIPNSVISVGNYAFYSCTSLTNVTIPNSVTGIESNAFYYCSNLTSVTIPNSVTGIGSYAFLYCTSLTDVAVGNSVTKIGYGAFADCFSLTNLTIPNSVTSIGDWAFENCTSLTTITIPASVSSIGDWAFALCESLIGVYFQGDAPSPGGSSLFSSANNATVYYLPGTTGWSPTFGGRPTALWLLPNPLILNNGSSFGVQTNCFGFIISWATNIPVVVEACADLANRVWSPVATNTLTSGSSYFSDPQWTNYPGRFYRLRSP